MRPVSKKELPAFLALLREPSVKYYLLDNVDISEEKCLDLIEQSVSDFEKHKVGLWGLFEERSRKLFGISGFFFTSEVELIYIVGPQFRGNGIAIKSLQMAIKFYNAAGRKDPIYARIDTPNKPSLAVARRLGMKKVGEEKNPETGGLLEIFRLDAGDARPIA